MLRGLGARPISAYPTATVGTKAIIGGEFDSPEIFRVMREASSRGPRPRIAVILSSKDGINAARKAYFKDKLKDGKIDPSIRRWFTSHGFEPVYIPLTIDNIDTWSHDRLLAETIASCDAVYLAGGDQAKHVKCLLEADGKDTPVMRAIRSVADNGGLVSGSSAGAAAQGGLQYGAGSSYRYLVENRLVERTIDSGTLYNEDTPGVGSFQRGLALLRDDVLVCTHFDQMSRLGRLLVALRVTGQATGIGVDEDTALFVRGSRGKVIGSNAVFFADTSQAKYGEGPCFSVEGLRLTYLTHGDEIDVDTLNASSDKPVAPAPESGKTVSRENILASLEMTKLIEEMVRSGAERATGTTSETEPRFIFELVRDPQSRTYDDGKHVSATELILNVRTT